MSVNVPLDRVTERLDGHGLLVAPASANPMITGATDDSRDVTPGDLYCAWTGTSSDSHGYVPGAAEAGAAAALVERVVDAPLPQVVVRDGRRAAAVGASVVYGDPQEALRVVGITGTNGKTTSVWIVRHLLSRRFPAASLGTLGVILEDGSTVPGSGGLTTPGPVELARTLRLLVDRGVEALAMETSSHALHQGRVEAMRFDAAVFTNLSRDHLDYHGTLAAYLDAKLGLADLIRDDGCAIINADDASWAPLRSRARRVLSFGVDGDADLRALNVRLAADGARFDCLYAGETYPAMVPLLGGYNVQNALAAVAACISMGMAVEAAVADLASVPQVPGRLERIADTPCPVLRDYAHTPDALYRALAALRPLTPGRVIVVFGAGGDRDRGKRPIMGHVAQAGSDIAIVTSDNPRTEDPDAIMDEIVAEMKPGTFQRIADRRAAIASALDLARPDDIVLLAGKGHEDYQIIGTTKHSFDERDVVAELLGARGAGA